MTAKLSAYFNNEWAQKEAALKNELVMEKAALKRPKKKVQKKIDRIWNFQKSYRVGSSTALMKSSPNEDAGDDDTDDDGDDQYSTLNLGAVS